MIPADDLTTALGHGRPGRRDWRSPRVRSVGTSSPTTGTAAVLADEPVPSHPAGPGGGWYRLRCLLQRVPPLGRRRRDGPGVPQGPPRVPPPVKGPCHLGLWRFPMSGATGRSKSVALGV